jgi:integrase
LVYCFAQPNGEPIRKEALRAPMAQALSAINAVGSLRPYAVRHCHAMVSLRGDLRMRELDAIAQRLGHTNRAMLHEVYASRVIYDL